MIRYFKQKNDLSKVCVVFEGSNTEESHEQGCSHLIEHLMCKRVDHLNDYFFNNAIEFNAEITGTSTCFSIEGLDSKVKQIANEFIKSITSPKLSISELEFKKEKKIILQEFDECMMNEETSKFLSFLSNQKIALTIGNKNTIKKITYNQIQELFNKNLTKPVACLIEQSSNWKIDEGINFKEQWESPWTISHEVNSSYKHQVYGGQETVVVSTNLFHEQAPHLIINEMLCGSLFSPLMFELREKNQFVYSISYGTETINDLILHNVFTFSVNKKNKTKAKELFIKVVNSNWLNKELFEATKTRLLLLIEIENKSGHLSEINKFLNPESDNLLKEVAAVTFDEVCSIVEDHYRNGNLLIY